MSILHLAVEAQGRRTGQGIREILQAAYYKRFQKPISENALAEDIRKYSSGGHIPYLYDTMIGEHK